jgi:esterase/lipase superfamily enzyme
MAQPSLDRRDVLRTAAASAGTTVLPGVAVASDQQNCTTTEDPFDGCEGASAPSDFPYLYDHDDDGTDEQFGTWPSNPSELVFFVHGYQSQSTQNGVNQAYAAKLAAEHNGYAQPFAAVCWDSDTTWSTAKRRAEDEGRRLGEFLLDYMADHPDTTIRLLGHSLGNRVVVYCLRTLTNNGAAVDSAAALGGAIDADSVIVEDGTDQSEFDEEIESAAAQYNNYHKTDDQVLNVDYEAAEGEEAVGEVGANGGTTPSNYTDHDVTRAVCNHCTYHKTNKGCMGEVVRNW